MDAKLILSYQSKFLVQEQKPSRAKGKEPKLGTQLDLRGKVHPSVGDEKETLQCETAIAETDSQLENIESNRTCANTYADIEANAEYTRLPLIKSTSPPYRRTSEEQLLKGLASQTDSMRSDVTIDVDQSQEFDVKSDSTDKSNPSLLIARMDQLSTETRKIDVKPRPFCRTTSTPNTPDGPHFLQEGTQLTYTHPAVQNDILKNLYALQRKGDMCDVLIRVQGVDFKCHKIVLAAASPYFAELFKDIKSVRIDRLMLEGLSAQSVAAMVGYFYTATLIIDSEDVEELLKSAYYFKTVEVVQLCIDYLEVNMAIHNCFSYYNLAAKHDIKEFQIKIFIYICSNFKSITKDESFLECSPEMLQQIVANNRVKVKFEEEVYSAVWRWYQHNPEDRKNFLNNICANINFHLMALRFIEEIVKKEMYLVSEFCRNKVDTAVQFINTGNNEENAKLESFRQVSDNVYLFVSSARSCDIIDLVTCKIEPVPELQLPIENVDHSYHVTIKAGKRIYTLSKSKVICFNPSSMKWDVYAEGISLTDSTVCSTKSSIYVVGGNSNGRQLWALSLPTRTWQSLPEMKVDRRSPAAACMGNSKPRLFVAGGYSVENGCVLDTVECYNATEKTWKTIKTSMSIPRLQANMIAGRKRLYVVGGRNKQDALTSVDVYDRTSQKWSLTDGPLAGPKLESALVLFEGSIYSIAGKGSVLVETLVESDTTRTWKLLGKLDKPLVGLQGVVY